MNEFDDVLMRQAIAAGWKSEPCGTCYRVGAVIRTPEGAVYEGYTHETGPTDHAEEAAISKALAAGESLEGLVIYTSMEPCSKRSSKKKSCTELIIENRFSAVFFALSEPDLFVDCQGAALLQLSGIEVYEVPVYAQQVIDCNAHLISEL